MTSSKFIITFFISFFALIVDCQTNQIWNNYSVYNPAATAVGYHHDLSATVAFTDEDHVSELLSCDLQRPVLHGAFGISINGFSSLKLNYNYQISLSDEAKLAVGVSAGFDPEHVSFPNTNFFANTYPWYAGLGVHFKYKGFVCGGSYNGNPWMLRKVNVFDDARFGYLSYEIKITEKFAIIPRVLYSEYFEERTEASLCVRMADLITVGGSYSDLGFGGLFGLYFKRRHIQMNYGIEMIRESALYSGSPDLIRHSVNFRIAFPEKEWKRSTTKKW